MDLYMVLELPSIHELKEKVMDLYSIQKPVSISSRFIYMSVTPGFKKGKKSDNLLRPAGNQGFNENTCRDYAYNVSFLLYRSHFSELALKFSHMSFIRDDVR